MAVNLRGEKRFGQCGKTVRTDKESLEVKKDDDSGLSH